MEHVVGPKDASLMAAVGLAVAVVAFGLVGCGDDEEPASSSSDSEAIEETSSPTSEDEATEQLGLEIVKDENLAADFQLPDSDCVAEAMFFGESAVSSEQDVKGVVTAESGDWGVRLAGDSDTPECEDAWQEAMG